VWVVKGFDIALYVRVESRKRLKLFRPVVSHVGRTLIFGRLFLFIGL
jgi:hypothetical protein